MVTDRQVRILMKQLRKKKSLRQAAAQAGMSERTARKYRDVGRLPSEAREEHMWRTRRDPFDDVWDEVRAQLELSSGLQAKTLFEDLQRKHPGRFSEGQLRTLQRRIRVWRATEGPAKEPFFPQEHHPGDLCESDFTHMESLLVTIAGQRFEHLLYHFVMTYSNWEAGTVCFSETMESLSAGLQNALFELGGLPKRHRSDRLSAAVNNLSDTEEFTRRYGALLAHYDLAGEKTQAGHGNENGDVEQSHRRFKAAVEQELLLRGSRDFASREEYEGFLRAMMARRNASRRERFEEERARLRPLPPRRREDCQRVSVRVSPGSTIRVLRNTYSVHSRLIGENVEVRVFAEQLEVWYAQRKVETLPRLAGRTGHRIEYRHIIEWLVRKPGAFANYRYREDLFPTSQFRLAYDRLKEQHAPSADRQYLRILELSALEGESRVEAALRRLLKEQTLSWERVEHLVKAEQPSQGIEDVSIARVDLTAYDGLCAAVAAEVVRE